MRLIFLGSPAVAIHPLRTLLEQGPDFGHELIAVVSQPAKPVGRRAALEDPPVARFAKEAGLLTLQPLKAGDQDFLDKLKDLAPDVMITAAYGQILPDSFLAIPRRATINIHPSLIPRYRGATPVPAALLDGCKETGVTILFTVSKLDAGAIIEQSRSLIRENETTLSLTERLFAEGGELLFSALEKLKHPDFTGTKQDEAAVSHCHKIKKTDGLVNWSLPAKEILNRFRAYYPWPGSYTFFQDRRLGLLRLAATPRDMTTLEIKSLQAGQVGYDKPRKCLIVGTGAGLLDVMSLHPAGGKVIDAAAFWNGLKSREKVTFSNIEPDKSEHGGHAP
jgi:methionyl-tRNA formyltransferase